MVSFSHIEASVFNSVSYVTTEKFFEVHLIIFFYLKAAASDILFFIKMSG